jgi:hypothetical protein
MASTWKTDVLLARAQRETQTFHDSLLHGGILLHHLIVLVEPANVTSPPASKYQYFTSELSIFFPSLELNKV